MAPTLYLFNNVFFPETVIPVTVSDAASKELLLQCFENKQLITLFHPGKHSKGIGTLGRILTLEYNADENVVVMVHGLNRIRFTKEIQTTPFPIFEFVNLHDTEDSGVVLEESLERLFDIMNNWLNRHITSKKERSDFMREMKSPSKLINNLCFLIIKDIELKEIFLHSTSVPEKIRMLDAVLRGLAPEIEDQAISEAIKEFENLTNYSKDESYRNAA